MSKNLAAVNFIDIPMSRYSLCNVLHSGRSGWLSWITGLIFHLKVVDVELVFDENVIQRNIC